MLAHFTLLPTVEYIQSHEQSADHDRTRSFDLACSQRRNNVVGLSWAVRPGEAHREVVKGLVGFEPRLSKGKDSQNIQRCCEHPKPFFIIKTIRSTIRIPKAEGER